MASRPGPLQEGARGPGSQPVSRLLQRGSLPEQGYGGVLHGREHPHPGAVRDEREHGVPQREPDGRREVEGGKRRASPGGNRDEDPLSRRKWRWGGRHCAHLKKGEGGG